MKKQLAKQKRGVFSTGASGCGGGSSEVRRRRCPPACRALPRALPADALR
jgi:hypothetical protein